MTDAAASRNTNRATQSKKPGRKKQEETADQANAPDRTKVQPQVLKRDEQKAQSPKNKKNNRRSKYPNPTPRLSISREGLNRLRLVAVAYSHVEREWFPTEEAFVAEQEVEQRAQEVLQVMNKLGIPGRLYPADEYFLTNLMVDRPDLVLNLVDTLRGKDALQTSVPGALEIVDIPYTGAGMAGLVIGNNRNLFKQILAANDIPTPAYQFIQRVGTKVKPDLGLPLIVKLNESGGSVGIDNAAVKESLEAAQKQVDTLISTYHLPVVVERFIDGPEITAVVFEDSRKRHIFMGQKQFGFKPDGKHEFTSLESYQSPDAYQYMAVNDEGLVRKIEGYLMKAFSALQNEDYAKYDIRVDAQDGTPYFTDCNPNTAFGPNLGLPFTELLDRLYGVKFEKVLAALISKYAKKIKTQR
jgi:D-alanine-D-alanine ligase